MGRRLFHSERRFLLDALASHGVRAPSLDDMRVRSEYYAPPRVPARTRFNNDFCLEFVPAQERGSTACYVSRILPNALGAELFVLVDPQSGAPAMAELLSGEAFPFDNYADFVQPLQQRLDSLAVPVVLREAAYCRILIVGGHMSFLAFPGHTAPVARGTPQIVVEQTNLLIAAAHDAEGIVYVDGWSRVTYTDQPWKLEAVETS